jgi:hypothetical protein
MNFKLGKLAAKHDPQGRTLHLAKYLTLVAPPKPLPTVDWNTPFDKLGGILGMDGNDDYGDCFWAAMEHDLKIKHANAFGEVISGSTDEVLAAYSAGTGFSKNDPNSDQGTIMLDGLKFMRSTGMTMGAAGVHKIGAFVRVNQKDHDEVRVAIDLFGGAHLGVMFPEAWEGDPVWDATFSRIVGGHAILLTAHDVDHPLRLVTWGSYRGMTWEGLDQQCDELFVSLDPDWLKPGSTNAPSGIDWTTLNSDLQAVSA